MTLCHNLFCLILLWHLIRGWNSSEVPSDNFLKQGAFFNWIRLVNYYRLILFHQLYLISQPKAALTKFRTLVLSFVNFSHIVTSWPAVTFCFCTITRQHFPLLWHYVLQWHFATCTFSPPDFLSAQICGKKTVSHEYLLVPLKLCWFFCINRAPLKMVFFPLPYTQELIPLAPFFR